MKCFACDALLEAPTLDKPTGRYYCSTCMEPTNQVILSQIQSELEQEELALYGVSYVTDIVNDIDDISFDSLGDNEEGTEDSDFSDG